MRLEIIVFLVALGFFLYWKLGGKFAMPQIGGIGEKLGCAAGFLAGYLVPILLFVVLCAVLWLTNDTLHWWSFLIRDGKAFTALVLTYFVFVSSFMQDKEKPKAFYQKVMVWVMVAAVDFTLMGLTPSNVWNKYGADGTKHSQAAGIPSLTPAIKNLHTQKTMPFTEGFIPPGTDFLAVVKEEDLIAGCNVIVEHDGAPQGGVPYDCADDIKLGSNLRNLHLRYISKETEAPIEVMMTLTHH